MKKSHGMDEYHTYVSDSASCYLDSVFGRYERLLIRYDCVFLMLTGNGRWADVVLGWLEMGERKVNASSAQGKEGKEVKKKPHPLPLVLTCMHTYRPWKKYVSLCVIDGPSTDASDYGS